MRFAHTNLVARDWRRLSEFYQDVFQCVLVPPERDQAGEWLDRATGVQGAHLRGVHLRVPGHGDGGPTLEIYQYTESLDRPDPVANRLGLAHLAFEVEDVAGTVARLLSAGGALAGEVVQRDIPGAGHLELVYARDVEGNLVEVQRWDRAHGETVAAEEAYEQWADEYDEVENRTRDLDAEVLGQMLPDLDGKDVLELGCGTGKNTLALASARSVTAVDLSEAMLERARAKVELAHVRFVQHDLRRPLPFDPSSFDLVTFNLVLEHLEHLGPVMAEAARVLRPGGEVLTVEYHPFRQLRGGGARFEGQAGKLDAVEAYYHSVSDHIAAALGAGLVLDWLGEHHATGDDVPRLLSSRLRRPPTDPVEDPAVRR